VLQTVVDYEGKGLGCPAMREAAQPGIGHFYWGIGMTDPPKLKVAGDEAVLGLPAGLL
jgi:hypothetical protein